MTKVQINECKKIHKKIIEKHNQLREIYKFNFHRRSASGIDPIQKTSDKIISEIHMIREEIIDEWEIYLEKIPVTKILKELDKLDGLFNIVNELKNSKTTLFNNLTMGDLKHYHKVIENLMNILYTRSNIRIKGTFNYQSGQVLYSVKLIEQDNGSDPKII